MPEIKPLEDKPSESLSFFATMKKLYPVTDVKENLKGAGLASAAAIVSPIVTKHLKKLGSSFFPKVEVFKPLDYKALTPPSWTRLNPVAQLVKRNYLSAFNAKLFVAPMSEELLFRGVLMPSMQHSLKKMGMKDNSAALTSAAMNSLFFALAHPKQARVSLFISSLLWSYITQQYDGNLIPATAGHMANNALAVTVEAVRHTHRR